MSGDIDTYLGMADRILKLRTELTSLEEEFGAAMGPAFIPPEPKKSTLAERILYYGSKFDGSFSIKDLSELKIDRKQLSNMLSLLVKRKKLKRIGLGQYVLRSA